MANAPQTRSVDGYLLAGLLLIAAAMVYCVAAAQRRGLEYDELWTLKRYARQGSVERLFTDLATPNNHPLHSLLVRAVLGGPASNAPEWWMRLPVLIAGALTLLLVSSLAGRLIQDREGRFLAVAWCVTNAALLHFTQTARGYMLQTAFLLGCFWCLTAAQRDGKNSGWKRLGAAICGWGAALILPVSLVFLLPLFGGDLVWRLTARSQRGERMPGLIRGELKAIIAALVCLVPIVLWLLKVRIPLEEARTRFGLSIVSVSDWFGFAGRTLGALFGAWLLVLILLGLGLRRQRSLKFWLAGVLLVPLLLSAVTNAGPVRAYVALVPFGTMLAAAAFVELLDFLERSRWQRGRSFVVIAAALLPATQLTANLRNWTPPDWREVVPVLRRHCSPDVYFCYPATAGYVAMHYDLPELWDDLERRAPTTNAFTLAVVDTERSLEGIDPITFASMDVELPAQPATRTVEVGGVSVTFFQARPISVEVFSSNSTSQLLVALGPGDIIPLRQALQKLVTQSEQTEWLAVNGLYNPVVIPPRSFPQRTSVLLAAKGVRPDLAKLRKTCGLPDDQLHFFEVAPAP